VYLLDFTLSLIPMCWSIGDGDYYCDMRGTGMDDYVSKRLKFHAKTPLTWAPIRSGYPRMALAICMEIHLIPRTGIRPD
jgi:hypothetical protein